MGMDLKQRWAPQWLVMAAAAAMLPVSAQDPSRGAVEYQIKATFLYSLAKFVDWPPEKLEENSPILVGIYGKDPFGATIDQALQDKTVNGRTLVIRRLTGLEQVRQYHILFISSAEKKQLAQILSAVGDGGVMTVGEVASFAEQGGMVNFVLRENSVGLEINVGAAERARIKFSSKLLRLARVVEGKGPPRRN